MLDANPQPLGTLRGHLSRANCQWQDFSTQVPALIVFSGPQHYISPSWYPSKKEHGRVVPTWNYVVVHAYGHLKLFEDPVLLGQNVQDLTELNEGDFEKPWKVADAPEAYVGGLLKAIIGIEIPIDRIEGKWKLSQNRSRPDRAGAAAGLRELATPESLTMAAIVEQAAAEES